MGNYRNDLFGQMQSATQQFLNKRVPSARKDVLDEVMGKNTQWEMSERGEMWSLFNQTCSGSCFFTALTPSRRNH